MLETRPEDGQLTIDREPVPYHVRLDGARVEELDAFARLRGLPRTAIHNEVLQLAIPSARAELARTGRLSLAVEMGGPENLVLYGLSLERWMRDAIAELADATGIHRAAVHRQLIERGLPLYRAQQAELARITERLIAEDGVAH